MPVRQRILATVTLTAFTVQLAGCATTVGIALANTEIGLGGGASWGK